MFDTDFFGAIDMIKAVTPEVRARGGGHIVNVTGIVTNPPNTRQAENLDGDAEVAQRKELIVAFGEHLPGDPAKPAAWTPTVRAWEDVTVSMNFDRDLLGRVPGARRMADQRVNVVSTSSSLRAHRAAAWSSSSR